MVSSFEQEIPLQELTFPVSLLLRYKQRKSYCEVISASAVAMGVPVETESNRMLTLYLSEYVLASAWIQQRGKKAS